MSKLVDRAPESVEVETEALLSTPEQQIEYIIPKASGPKEMEITKDGEYFREEKPPDPPPDPPDPPNIPP